MPQPTSRIRRGWGTSRSASCSVVWWTGTNRCSAARCPRSCSPTGRTGWRWSHLTEMRGRRDHGSVSRPGGWSVSGRRPRSDHHGGVPPWKHGAPSMSISSAPVISLHRSRRLGGASVRGFGRWLALGLKSGAPLWRLSSRCPLSSSSTEVSGPAVEVQPHSQRIRQGRRAPEVRWSRQWWPSSPSTWDALIATPLKAVNCGWHHRNPASSSGRVASAGITIVQLAAANVVLVRVSRWTS